MLLLCLFRFVFGWCVLLWFGVRGCAGCLFCGVRDVVVEVMACFIVVRC